MRNFVGAFDCIDKLKYALRQPFAQQKQLFTHVSATPEVEPAIKKKKIMKNRNYLTNSHFGGGNSVFTGLASIFHTSTKRRLLSCQRAIIAVFFALFATGCTRYEYIHLIDEDEEYNETPSDTTSHDSINIGFTFNPNDDEDTIEVDLNPGYSSYCPSYKLKENSSGNRKERDACVVSNAAR